MRILWTLALMLLASSVLTAESGTDGLAPLRWLVGEWRGVGQGDPGISGSERPDDSYIDGKHTRTQGGGVYPKHEKSRHGEAHAKLDFRSYDAPRVTLEFHQDDTLSNVAV